MGQLVLRGGRAGRLGELEGVLLRLVRRGQLDHFRANGGSSAAQEIAAWVAQTFTAQTVDRVTRYDPGATAEAS
ncbi:hypothetical protein [Micromonospora sp. NPDC049102]|uniref:hypothetical protein n=1 Tax=Micromonospora sp. NPDC049102 TaxID=3364265 RepID=UPI003720B826